MMPQLWEVSARCFPWHRLLTLVSPNTVSGHACAAALLKASHRDVVGSVCYGFAPSKQWWLGKTLEQSWQLWSTCLVSNQLQKCREVHTHLCLDGPTDFICCIGETALWQSTNMVQHTYMQFYPWEKEVKGLFFPTLIVMFERLSDVVMVKLSLLSNLDYHLHSGAQEQRQHFTSSAPINLSFATIHLHCLPALCHMSCRPCPRMVLSHK